ncbi:hypothetical protein ACWD5Q_14005 [Streptomyces sp. NPDC002513]
MPSAKSLVRDQHRIVGRPGGDRVGRSCADGAEGPRLADAVTEAVVEQYTNTGEREREALLLIIARTALRDAFLDTTAGIEPPSRR